MKVLAGNLICTLYRQKSITSFNEIIRSKPAIAILPLQLSISTSSVQLIYFFSSAYLPLQFSLSTSSVQLIYFFSSVYLPG